MYSLDGDDRHKKTCTRRCYCTTFLIVLSLVFVAIGVAIIEVFPKFMNKEIKKELEIYNGSSSWDKFVRPTEPVIMQYWLYNITNPDDVILGIRPNVEEIGPFTYREQRVKVNLHFNNNGTVSYREDKSYYFQPYPESAASDETEICTINIMQTILSSMLKPLLANLSTFAEIIITGALQTIEALNGEDAMMCAPAREIVFDLGDRVFATLKHILLNLGEDLRRVANSTKSEHLKQEILNFTTQLDGVVSQIPIDVSLQNNLTSPGDNYTVYTGKTDISLITIIDQYNHHKNLSWWGSSYCNQIRGTDATQFHPNVKKTDKLYLYSTDLCRTIYVVYNGTVDVKGISLYRFTPPPALFDNGTVHPELKGFCVPHCWPSGVQDISSCQHGAPFIVSSPHFLYGDPVYLQNFTGMSPPSFHEHATFLDVEPYTGLMMSAQKRLQVNIVVRPIPFLSDGKNLPDVVLPIFFANESVVVSDSDAHKFKTSVYFFVSLATYLKWVLVGVGSGIFLLVFGVNVYITAFKKEEEELLEPYEGEDDSDEEHKPLIN